MTVPSLFKEHTVAALRKLTSLDFDLPPEMEADAPPEARGFARDEVRLMVSYRSDDSVVHSTFREIEDFLKPGTCSSSTPAAR